MNFKALFVICAITTILAGCRTGGVILRETPSGISETRRVIASVTGEPRTVNKTGREMLSKYYDRAGNPIAKMEMARERRYTRITILGDRRPYDIQVEVLVESRDSDGTFFEKDHDDAKAAVLAEKIKQTLNQSRDNRNVIDDFRSF